LFLCSRNLTVRVSGAILLALIFLPDVNWVDDGDDDEELQVVSKGIERQLYAQKTRANSAPESPSARAAKKRKLSAVKAVPTMRPAAGSAPTKKPVPGPVAAPRQLAVVPQALRVR
jgi:hypothetical protein